MKRIEVVAAVIRRRDEVFATQRGYGDFKDWWEFPGGKMEPGETPREALAREIREELDAEISVGEKITTVEWDYPGFHLTMHCFWCSLRSEALHLNEHESAAWLGASNLDSVRWLPADEGILPAIASGLSESPLPCVTPSLREYVESQIIPRYDHFDKGHDRGHVNAVIAQGLAFCRHYDVNPDIVYTAAAYHDTGICEGRERHHIVSARIIRDDATLRRWFSPEEIDLIANAAEDHRASSKTEPRGIYGKIIAEADRQIDPEDIIRRTVLYGLGHYPELDMEGHWQRTLEHMHEKYAEGGYLRLWIPESPNAARLASLRKIIADEGRLRYYFEKYYICETNSPNTMKKIIATPLAPKAVGPYSQAVELNGTLYVSGQLPADPETGDLAEGIEAQTRRSLDNIGAILTAAGLSFGDVVKVTVLLDDIANFGAMNAVYAEYFPGDKPARVCYEVSALPKGAKVEIDAVAGK